MFTFEQIKELVELVARRGLHGLEVERSGFRLHIHGMSGAAQAAAPSGASPVSPAPAYVHVAATGVPATREAATGEPATGGVPDGAHVINSPIVGTFYSAPSPDAPPFVQPGDRVRKGQVLCIVEAMKIMNEIESDADGTLLEVYPKNAQPIEYGEPLFAVRLH